jgi:uncharacterized protein (DUF885 family)
MPGFVLAYPLGGIEWQKMRDRAQASLAKRFNVRAFHQMELEDGMLPFAALEAKLDAWIKAQGQVEGARGPAADDEVRGGGAAHK